MWKWCAIVEDWAWRNTEEKNHPALQRELQQVVDFTWIARGDSAAELGADPSRWQSNTKGESLLSVHRTRKPAKGGE